MQTLLELTYFTNKKALQFDNEKRNTKAQLIIPDKLYHPSQEIPPHTTYQHQIIKIISQSPNTQIIIPLMPKYYTYVK